MNEPESTGPPSFEPGALSEASGAPADTSPAAPALLVPSHAMRRRVTTVGVAGLVALLAILWIAGRGNDWFVGGPRAVAGAQLADIDRGQLRLAYDLFSPRYRVAVSFEAWSDLVLTHRRMFQTRGVRFGDDEVRGSRALLDVHLVAESGDRYVARFTMIRVQGHWRVDDLHWSREPGDGSLVTT